MVVAVEIDQLDARRADLEPSELERLAMLEQLLEPATDEDEARKTGDPLADYWEHRISRDLPVDLDAKTAPPREEWDRP